MLVFGVFEQRQVEDGLHMLQVLPESGGTLAYVRILAEPNVHSQWLPGSGESVKFLAV